jgi:hypothetical protein
MARTARPARITTPAQRQKLPPDSSPWWHPIEPGLRLGYRRTKAGARHAGTWWACLARPSGKQRKKTFGVADDHDPANGRTILSYGQAQFVATTWARKIAAGDGRGSELPDTVREALIAYHADKLNAGQDARAGDVHTMLGRHLQAELAATRIAELTAPQLRAWVASLRNMRNEHRANEKRLTQHRVDGLRGVMKAALHGAKADRETLRDGLGAHTTAAATGGARTAPVARMLILGRPQIDSLLTAISGIDGDLLRFCRVLDMTGARPSQVARLKVDDIIHSRGLLRIPRSAKGRPGSHKHDAIYFPLPASMLDELRAKADPATGLVLHRPLRRQEPGSVGHWRIEGRAA